MSLGVYLYKTDSAGCLFCVALVYRFTRNHWPVTTYLYCIHAAKQLGNTICFRGIMCYYLYLPSGSTHTCSATDWSKYPDPNFRARLSRGGTPTPFVAQISSDGHGESICLNFVYELRINEELASAERKRSFFHINTNHK